MSSNLLLQLLFTKNYMERQLSFVYDFLEGAEKKDLMLLWLLLLLVLMLFGFELMGFSLFCLLLGDWSLRPKVWLVPAPLVPVPVSSPFSCLIEDENKSLMEPLCSCAIFSRGSSQQSSSL